MKDPEDEAFDEIAKRQGTWGLQGSRKHQILSFQTEEFNRVERESKAKQESIRSIKHPTREQLMAEIAVLVELVRVLSDRVKELENK